MLPTKQEVIERVLNEDNFYSMNAARVVANELARLWIWNNVYPVHELTIAKKIFEMMKEFRIVDHYPKNKRSKPSYTAKQSQFLSDADKLFDIFCHDENKEENWKRIICYK